MSTVLVDLDGTLASRGREIRDFSASVFKFACLISIIISIGFGLLFTFVDTPDFWLIEVTDKAIAALGA